MRLRSFTAAGSSFYRTTVPLVWKAMIEDLRRKVSRGELEFSLHAVRQMVIREITPEEVDAVICCGAVIEDYPEDKYGPSCLLLGRTSTGRPLHVQCTFPSRPLVKVVTVYEPNPVEWSADLRERLYNEETHLE